MGFVLGAKRAHPPDPQSVQIQYFSIADHLHQPVGFFRHEVFVILHIPGKGDHAQAPFLAHPGKPLRLLQRKALLFYRRRDRNACAHVGEPFIDNPVERRLVQHGIRKKQQCRPAERSVLVWHYVLPLLYTLMMNHRPLSCLISVHPGGNSR